VAVAQVVLAILEQLRERTIDVAKAKEAEVEGWDAVLAGAKAR